MWHDVNRCVTFLLNRRNSMKIEQCYINQQVAFRMKTSETESMKVVGKITEINKDLEMVWVSCEQDKFKIKRLEMLAELKVLLNVK